MATKGERREEQRKKRKYAPTVVGRSVFLLQEQHVKRATKKGAK